LTEKLRVHWETQYRKVVEEPSCIRRPDTGQVLYREPQYKRKRVEESLSGALGPSKISARERVPNLEMWKSGPSSLSL
jgi:hypothetical protein